MKHRSIWYHKLYIDGLFAKGDMLEANQEFELLSHWTRYLCVLVSGWIEVSVHEVYLDYTQKRASTEVNNFVLRKLKRLQSPKMNCILDLTGSFSSDWAASLKISTNGAIKTAVDTIVENRNHIAHGESSDISFRRLKDYYVRATEAIQLLEQQCDPAP